MSNQTKTIEERLTQLEQHQSELTEHVSGALESIKYTLAYIKKDYYDTPEEGEKDLLDQAIEELEDSIKWIDELINDEEE